MTACRSTSVNRVEPATQVGQNQMISDKRVLTDQTLNNIVRIVGLNTATGEEGFLKVQVQVECFWGCFGRKPINWWQNGPEQKMPAFGQWVRMVTFQDEIVYGRYVHAWNNIGRLVLPDGTFAYRAIGGRDWDAEELLDKVRALRK